MAACREGLEEVSLGAGWEMEKGTGARIGGRLLVFALTSDTADLTKHGLHGIAGLKKPHRLGSSGHRIVTPFH